MSQMDVMITDGDRVDRLHRQNFENTNEGSPPVENKSTRGKSHHKIVNEGSSYPIVKPFMMS